MKTEEFPELKEVTNKNSTNTFVHGVAPEM